MAFFSSTALPSQLASKTPGGYERAPAPRWVAIVSPLPGGPGQSSPPVVSNLEPPAGSLVRPDTPISFDITDADGFSLIIPMMSLNDFTTPEPVTNNLDGFEPLYQGSTRTAITGGYHYVLRRKGGWTATPRLIIWAVDRVGSVYVN